MDENTKCEIYRLCYNAFHDSWELVLAAVNIVHDRVCDKNARNAAIGELRVVAIDTLYEDASSQYRNGDDIDALVASAMTRMPVSRLAQLAEFAFNPPMVMQ